MHDGPPPLSFTLRSGRRLTKCALFLGFVIFDTGILPLILFYALRWSAHLSITINLAIITSVIGLGSSAKLTHRTYLLWYAKGCESRRPIGSGRWGLDATHFFGSWALFAFLVPLIIGSSMTPASVPIVSMALPCQMLSLSVPCLISAIFDHHLRLPVRISSLPPGEILPPFPYTLVEDVIAVDGGGGLAFRQEWRHRYEDSVIIRSLVRQLAFMWGLSGTIIGALLIVAAWLATTDTAYGLAYGIPWVWVLVCIPVTVLYVQSQLRREHQEWYKECVHKVRPLHVHETVLDKEVDHMVLERQATHAGSMASPRASVASPRRASMRSPRESAGSQPRRSRSRSRAPPV
ncbi:hypothetical protein CONPUDRAFT_105698 [Coniophora puteana RWD-64-598 SS2]|uniref:Uncharacterized protein n=1 Tax=Coniophora puteana (strain RWD-64-598) TaxID=741705 RepID=A0A5M3MNM9_CONPW|nr:uncharacterized protein CONPUDRAFT_105698 [Coniophora puteana RWD-64-598 SS2]EIW80620.1 hypothetical protein CONPUDRAFT_105698 [Coniophora puteana RWD-64-598 SS2]